MRVVLAQLTDFPEAGRIDIYEYARALAELGVETHVIVCRNCAGQLPKGLTVHELNLSTNAGPANARQFVRLALQTITKLSAERPIDIVHLFNPAPATWLLGWRLKRLANRPKIIYDVRTGGLGHGFDAFLINSMARLAPRFADGIITLSAALDRRLFGQKRPSHAVVPLGVATKRFRSLKQASRGQMCRFIYVGSLAENRRLTTMIEAFAVAHRQHPAIRLELIGSGNDQPRLERLVQTLGLETAVQCTGPIPFAEVPARIARANCGVSFIPMTPWFHPQPPLKTLEYLSCNLPVVATNTDSQRELWTMLPKGLLCQDNSADFATGFSYAYEHRQELSQTDFRAVALPFDWQTVTQKKLLPFYHQVIQANK